MSVQEKMTAMADAIRSATGTQEKLSLDQMAAAIHEIQAAAKHQGTQEFWDLLQDYGRRTDYRYAFFYGGYETIDPKHFARVTNGDSIFHLCGRLRSVNWEKFDLSAVSSLYNAFGYCYELEQVDTPLGLSENAETALNSIFRGCSRLRYVRQLKAVPKAVWKNSFDDCSSLEHIVFTGTIGTDGLNMRWSTKLDRESIQSVIRCLSDTVEDMSIILSDTAVDNAFGHWSEELYDGEPIWISGAGSDAWQALVNTKPNWYIQLL